MSTGGGLPDPGAQAERTSLAWQRTGLAAAAVGALIVHAAGDTGSVAWSGSLLVALGVVTAGLVGPLRYVRTLRAMRSGRSPRSRAAVLLTTAVLFVAIVGTAASLLSV